MCQWMSVLVCVHVCLWIYLSLSITSMSLLIAEWTPCSLHRLYCDYHHSVVHPHRNTHMHHSTETYTCINTQKDNPHTLHSVFFQICLKVERMFISSKCVDAWSSYSSMCVFSFCVYSSGHSWMSVNLHRSVCPFLYSPMCLCMRVCVLACLSSAPAVNEYVSAAHVNCWHTNLLWLPVRPAQ